MKYEKALIINALFINRKMQRGKSRMSIRFFPSDPDPDPAPDPTLIRNAKKKNIHILGSILLGIKYDFINHHFKLEFVDSGFYFVQDAYNFIYPLLQVESRSGSVEKSNGSG